jgi:hypothetical protein
MQDFHSHLPGFEPVGAVATYLHRIVHKYLNKHLSELNPHLFQALLFLQLHKTTQGTWLAHA